MTGLTRRGFVASAALAAAGAGIARGGAADAAGSRVGGATRPLLVYDGGLAAGRRFAERAAALGGVASALRGDRVPQVRALLAARPRALFGIGRHGDALLVEEIAREAGYRRLALIQHRGGGATVASCAPAGATIATLARHAGARWPEALAELALGGIAGCSAIALPGAADPAFSWVLARR